MLDPITFPNAIFELSLNKAWTVTKSSGHDVEKDIIVIPTTNVDILNLKARPTEPLTSKSPP